MHSFQEKMVKRLEQAPLGAFALSYQAGIGHDEIIACAMGHFLTPQNGCGLVIAPKVVHHYWQKALESQGYSVHHCGSLRTTNDFDLAQVTLITPQLVQREAARGGRLLKNVWQIVVVDHGPDLTSQTGQGILSLTSSRIWFATCDPIGIRDLSSWARGALHLPSWAEIEEMEAEQEAKLVAPFDLLGPRLRNSLLAI